MRVDGEGGNLEDMAHHDACRLVAYAGECFQLLEGAGNFSSVLFAERLGEVIDVLALCVEKSARLDDFGDCVDSELDHGGGRFRLLEQDFRNLVYADVGALRAQYDGDKHRVGAGVVERNRRVREELVQLFADEFDFFGALHREII